MAGYYDGLDISFEWNGDISLGKDGDLGDTSDDQIQALVQGIQTVIQSEFRDWQEHPTLAATLIDFVGEPNTRETGRAIEERAFTSLVTTGTVAASDLSVRAVPIDIHSILLIIKVSALSTPNNSLRRDDRAQVAFIFDTVERTVMPFDRIKPRGFFNSKG